MKLHTLITSLLDKSYELIYIDYDSNLNGHAKEFEDAVQTQDWSPIDGILEGFNFYENESDSIDYILKELSGEIQSAFDVDQERAEDFIEKYKDYFRDEIYERDNSNALKDLLRNTDDSICWYDTGYEIEEQSWRMTSKEFKTEINNIKKALQIKIKDSQYDKELSELLSNASYGGKLVIFFKGDIEKLMSLSSNNYKRVIFENAEVAIIDYCNGSGHNVNLPKSKMSYRLNVEDINFDLAHRYNYTDAVCGMSHNWCDSTDVKFSKR